jgi:hypothetical protein
MMKITRCLKLNIVIVLCLGFSVAATGLYAQNTQQQGFMFGDLGKPPDYDKTVKNFQKIPDFALLQLPSSYQVPVTPAKNQGSCGGCWAFASVGVLESRLLQKAGIIIDLSEQQQISCNTTSKGCKGGFMTALKYWYDTGPMVEDCTGYCACDEPCSSISKCPVLANETSGYYTVDTSFITDIKTSIYSDGAAFFRFDVYQDFMDYWRGNTCSVYTQKSGSYEGGHAVLIYGWDDNKQAWLCKNSWGKTAGPCNNGSFWMAYTGHANDLALGMANVVGVAQGFETAAWPVPNHWGSSDYTWVGDFNGDGKTDIASASGGNVYMNLSTGTGFNSQTWPVPNRWGSSAYTWVGDFNGDRKTDIASASGENVYMNLSIDPGFSPQTWTVPNQWGSSDYTWVGDFNGDGKTDIASAMGGNVHMNLSTGTGFNPQTWPVPNHWGSSDYTWVGDFNGDRKTDLASASGGNVYMNLSTGTGFNSQTWNVPSQWGGSDYTWVGDFNGDGNTDIASASGGNIYMKLSTGTGFNPQTWTVPNQWGGSDYTWVGDFNGDGKTDIASASGGNVYMKLSQIPR